MPRRRKHSGPKYPGIGPQAHMLRAGRLQAGLSQQALGDAVGLHVQTIAAYENGRKHATDPEIVAALADALALEPDALYIAAAIIPPDLHQWIAANPPLLRQLRQLQQRQIVKS